MEFVKFENTEYTRKYIRCKSRNRERIFRGRSTSVEPLTPLRKSPAVCLNFWTLQISWSYYPHIISGTESLVYNLGLLVKLGLKLSAELLVSPIPIDRKFPGIRPRYSDWWRPDFFSENWPYFNFDFISKIGTLRIRNRTFYNLINLKNNEFYFFVYFYFETRFSIWTNAHLKTKKLNLL